MRIFAQYKRQLILIAIVLIIGFIISLISNRFLTINNISNILNTNALLGIMALGMMMVISTGNIDRSVGAQFAASGMITALVAQATGGQSILLPMLAGVGTGIILGLINGFFVAKLKIPAIIVTIGTYNIIRGLLYVITNGNMIQNLRGPFVEFAIRRIGPFTIASYLWILMMLLTYFLVYKTNMGRNILAVGGNITAAERIGLKPTYVYFFVYSFMGAMAGLAAVLSISKLAVASPTAGGGYEMTLIASAVIGGTAFSGGIASVLGTGLGILLLGIIYNGLVLVKVPLYWQDLVTGITILAALISSAQDFIRKPALWNTLSRRKLQ